MLERCNKGACAGSLKGAKTARSVCTAPTHAASCFDFTELRYARLPF
jgi:hypothetical protein